MGKGYAEGPAAEEPGAFHLLYPDDMALSLKIDTIARQVYGADGV